MLIDYAPLRSRVFVDCVLSLVQSQLCSSLVLCSFFVRGMAGGEPAGFGYWIGVLVNSSGLNLREEVPRDKRVVFRKLARLLVANEFEHVDQLRDGVGFCFGARVRVLRLLAGAHPSKWIGADIFLQSELDLLLPMVRGCRSRSPVRQQQTR